MSDRIKIEVTPYLGQKIRILSMFAIAMVFIQHSGYGVSGTMTGKIFADLIPLGFCDFPVSYFFIVSGFFFARKCNSTMAWYFDELKKRGKTLLIPYSIYTLAGLAIWGTALRGSFLNSLGITSLLPVVGPLWYVRTLLVLCVISPLLIFVVRIISRIRLLQWVSVIVYLGAALVSFPARKSIFMAMTFFSLGIFLAEHGACFASVTKKTKFFVSLGVMVALLAFKVVWQRALLLPIYEDVFIRWLVIPATISFVWYAYDMIFNGRELKLHGVVESIIKGSFFIYCIESFVRVGVDKLHCVRALYANPLGVLAATVIILIATVAVQQVMSRLLPRVYAILSGGR